MKAAGLEGSSSHAWVALILMELSDHLQYSNATVTRCFQNCSHSEQRITIAPTVCSWLFPVARSAASTNFKGSLFGAKPARACMLGCEGCESFSGVPFLAVDAASFKKCQRRNLIYRSSRREENETSHRDPWEYCTMIFLPRRILVSFALADCSFIMKNSGIL